MKSFLFDFHAHFSFKPANSPNFQSGDEPDTDHWRERLGQEISSFAHFADKTVVKSSQLHGNACTTSGHRIICNGLYPLERGFISQALIKHIATLTGFSVGALRELMRSDISYFQALEREYQNLLDHAEDNTLSKAGNIYALVNSFDEIIANLKDDNTTINIFNSVEGAHAFASDMRTSNGTLVNIMDAERRHIKNASGNQDFKDFINAINQNIEHVKTQWEYVPMYVGLSHHYYNHIAGHSPSLGGIVDFFINQDGATIDKNGQPVNWTYLGIHPWGRGILNKLLSRMSSTGQPVRRMLVDMKHMSPQARMEYYEILDRMEQDNVNERVPIIKSHTAVSGRRNLRRTIAHQHALLQDEKESCKYFYEGIINLFDDEIVRIFSSDGLIGLMIDERRIMGRVLPPEGGFKKKGDFNKIAKDSRKALTGIVKCKNEITRLLKKLAATPGDAEMQKAIKALQKELKGHESAKDKAIPKLRPVYLSVIMRQIFHILDLTGERGWDHLCIGTDYDGVINPIDIYAQSSDMATIFDDMVDFWTAMTTHTDTEIKELYTRHLYGQPVAWWIRKLLILNGANFLKKYFNDDYLLDGVVPAPGWALTQAEMQTLGA